MHTKVITWQCDRCPRTVQMPEGEPPKGWAVVKSQTFTEAGGFEEWEVCDGCAHQHGRFMLGLKADKEGRPSSPLPTSAH